MKKPGNILIHTMTEQQIKSEIQPPPKNLREVALKNPSVYPLAVMDLFSSDQSIHPHISNQDLLNRANLDALQDLTPVHSFFPLNETTALGRNDPLPPLDPVDTKYIVAEIDRVGQQIAQLTSEALLKNEALQQFISRFISIFQPPPKEKVQRPWKEYEARSHTAREMGLTSTDLSLLHLESPTIHRTFERKVFWKTQNQSPFSKQIESPVLLGQVMKQLNELSLDIQEHLFWKYVKSFKSLFVTYHNNGREATALITNLSTLRLERREKPIGSSGQNLAQQVGFNGITVYYGNSPVLTISPGNARASMRVDGLRLRPLSEDIQSGQIILCSSHDSHQIFLDGDRENFSDMVAEKAMRRIDDIINYNLIFRRRDWDSPNYGYEADVEKPAHTIPELSRVWDNFIRTFSQPNSDMVDALVRPPYDLMMDDMVSGMNPENLRYEDIYKYCRWTSFLSPGGLRGKSRRLGLKLRRVRWTSLKLLVAGSLKDSFSDLSTGNISEIQAQIGNLLSSVRSSKQRKSIAHYDAPVNPKTVSLSKLIKIISMTTKSPDFTVRANPFRFLRQLSTISELSSYSQDQNPSFDSYSLPESNSKGITISSRKPSTPGYDPDGKLAIRLFAPQFALLMKAVISTKERTLMYGEDYSIEYDHRLGYYRAQLHTNDDSNEYFYQLVIDAETNHLSAPNKVENLTIAQTARLVEFRIQLADAGYSELAESLQTEIEQASATNRPINTQMITDALIRGTSYAIDDKYSSEQIKSALDLEGVNLTMIPAPTVDGRLMLQCTHSATLLAALFEYVFQDEIGEKGGGFYISRMFPLVSMGIGIKFSSTGHSDTRGAIGSDFITHDATPPISMRSVVGRIRSSFNNDPSSSVDAPELTGIDNDLENGGVLSFERSSLLYETFETAIIEITPRDPRGMIPTSIRFPEAVTSIGSLFRELQQYSRSLSSPLEVQPLETIESFRMRIHAAMDLWRMEGGTLGKADRKVFLKVFEGFAGARSHALAVLGAMDQYLESLIV